MTGAQVFDARPCLLGEGPLWHPKRQQLYWFDIMGKRLLTKGVDGPQQWQFDCFVSAAGWVDSHRLLIASATDLRLFDLSTGASEFVTPLEAGNPVTRSNDGRADPWGGFWIGTMGIRAEPKAGAIYRYFKGELRCLFPDISISNGIAFSPDGRLAYFADTVPGIVWRQALSQTYGWPIGDPEVFLDHGPSGPNPDGAVVDQEGNYWSAEWGFSRVRCYGPDGSLRREMPMPTSQCTCPVFAGRDLFVTSARQGVNETDEPLAGQVFKVADVTDGQEKHQVIL